MLRRVHRALARRLGAHGPAAQVPAGTLRLTATGRGDPQGRGNEVVLLEARTSSGLVVDLARLAGGGAEVMRDIVIEGQRPVPLGLKLPAGAALDLALGQKGSVLLLCHPWSGEVELRTNERSQAFNLFSAQHSLRRVELAELMPLLAPSGTVVRSTDVAADEYTRAEARRRLAALAPLRTEGDVQDNTLAIYTPRWKGVSAATRNLFRNTLAVPLTPDEHPDEVGEEYLAAAADAVLEAGFATIVFSGGDPLLFGMARRLKDARPSLSIRMLWHGSYLQMGEAHDWCLFRPWLEAGQSGLIDCIGVVKPGMEGFLRELSVRSCFVQNIVPSDRSWTSAPDAGDVVGIWLSGSSEFRKMPYATLLALAGLPRFGLRASGLGELGCRMIDELGIRTAALFAEPIPHSQVLREMRQTSLTLYVTLSECMPMVPMESIACGVPCIVGPATRFYDLPYLNQRLMVNDPTDPQAIRRTIVAAMDDHAEVRSQSLAFLDRLAERAAESLPQFLA